MMIGSQTDFVHRLIDAAPHIIVSDELRSPSPQPGVRAFPDAAVTLHGYKVRTEARGLKDWPAIMAGASAFPRSEEQTSDLQSLMSITYAVLCLKKKIQTTSRTKRQFTKNNDNRN